MIILIAVASLIVVVLLIASVRPGDFRISREIKILAAPDAIFPHLNTARKFEEWNPWAKIDPNAKNSYSGPAAGVGAVTVWDGNKQVGAGRMTIIESVPNSLVRKNLEFERPFKGESLTNLEIKSEGGQSVVVWSITGKNNFLPRLMCMFMDQEKMIGGTFAKGLADLKKIVEGK